MADVGTWLVAQQARRAGVDRDVEAWWEDVGNGTVLNLVVNATAGQGDAVAKALKGAVGTAAKGRRPRS